MEETIKQEIYSGLELEISKDFEKDKVNVRLSVTNGLKVVKHFLLRDKKRLLENLDFLKNNVSASEPVSEEQIKTYEEDMDAERRFYKAKIQEIEEMERIIQSIKDIRKEIMEEWENK